MPQLFNPKLIFVQAALVFLLCFQATANDPISDMGMLAAKVQTSLPRPASGPQWMNSGSNRLLVRYNPVRIGLSGLMYIYQAGISPQLPSECLYHTSCSNFSKRLISDLGLIPGVVATADRLMRCHRIAALDVHPMHLHPVSGKVEERTDMYKTGK